MADFESLHAAESEAREDAGGVPPAELPEPEPEPEPKELTEAEIAANEEKAAKKAAKKERKKREPAKELSLEALKKLGAAQKAKDEAVALIKKAGPSKTKKKEKPVVNNVAGGRIKAYTTEAQERAAIVAADAEHEERKLHMASAPKVIRSASVKAWTEMSNKIEKKLSKDPIARPSKKVQLGNKKKKKKKKKKDGDDDGDGEDEEVLGFGGLALPAVDDEEVFGFEIEGADAETEERMANAVRPTSIALEVKRGALVVAGTGETHAEEQARLKLEAEQRERERVAAEELAQKQAEAAAAAAAKAAKEKAAAELKEKQRIAKEALEKDKKFFAKKMEDANNRRQSLIDERKDKFKASQANAKKLTALQPLLSLVEGKEADVEKARLARIEAQQANVTKVDMEAKWKAQQDARKREGQDDAKMSATELDAEGIDLSFGGAAAEAKAAFAEEPAVVAEPAAAAAAAAGKAAGAKVAATADGSGAEEAAEVEEAFPAAKTSPKAGPKKTGGGSKKKGLAKKKVANRKQTGLPGAGL